MEQLIAKIGKGQRGSKDLTWDEAKLAMRLLIEDQVSPIQAGAFLMAMRIKMETISELAAFTMTARHYVSPLSISNRDYLLDLPLYGEKHETFHAIIASAIVASAAGASILMHGIENPCTTTDVCHVLAALGIPVDLSSQQVTETLEETGLAYLDMGNYHPALARYLSLRQELGVQNLFHQIARMLNPGRTKAQVIGIAHPPYLEKMVEAMDMLDSGHVLIFQGVEGFPELSIVNATSLRELTDTRSFSVNLKPKDVGFSFGPFHSMAAPKATPDAQAGAQEATLLQRLLENRITGSQKDWVVLNAALLLYISGRAPSVMAGVPLANQALNSGAAVKKLRQLSKKPTDSASLLSQPIPVHT